MSKGDRKVDEKEKKPTGIRILGSVSSLLLVCSIIYILVAGFNLASTLILVAALGGLAGPAVVAGDGVAECLAGILEMFLEGIQSIFSAIADIFGSILG